MVEEDHHTVAGQYGARNQFELNPTPSTPRDVDTRKLAAAKSLYLL